MEPGIAVTIPSGSTTPVNITGSAIIELMLVSCTEICCIIRSTAFLRSHAESPFGNVEREDISLNFSCQVANPRLGCFLGSCYNSKKQPTLSSGLVVLRQRLNVGVIHAVANSLQLQTKGRASRISRREGHGAVSGQSERKHATRLISGCSNSDVVGLQHGVGVALSDAGEVSEGHHDIRGVLHNASVRSINTIGAAGRVIIIENDSVRRAAGVRDLEVTDGHAGGVQHSDRAGERTGHDFSEDQSGHRHERNEVFKELLHCFVS